MTEAEILRAAAEILQREQPRAGVVITAVGVLRTTAKKMEKPEVRERAPARAEAVQPDESFGASA